MGFSSLDPYSTVQAETMSNQSKDIVVSGLGDTTVSGNKGSWIKLSGVECGTSAKSMTVRASSVNGAVIKVCTKSAAGTAVAYAEIPAGGGVQEITAPVTDLSGTQDIYFVFSDALVLDSWKLS